MSEEMKFPDTLDEFIKQYSFIDEEQIYTNGSELIHTFRVKQWEEHKRKENQKYKEVIDKAKSLNEEISHIIYEDFLEENVIGCKYLYERVKKLLDILKEVE